ncbi:MAG TPA: hypothetical protein VFM05_12615, partial [Candidatus Saccharimonadales bacterium]|nr:hypothetical protein [Candidatus Saccharimonadales bacterium]
MSDLLDSLLNGPSRWGAEHHFSTGWLAIFVIVMLLAELVLLYVLAWGVFTILRNTPSLFRLLLQKCGIGEKEVPHSFLELVFPADTTKSAYATEQLHILLHGLVKYYGFWDRLAARKKPYSLELLGTKDGGVRFILMIPTSETDIVRRNLLSFLPGLKVNEIDDYAKSVPAEDTNVIELRLNGDFILPLKDHKTLEEHDPFTYLTGHMTKLTSGELVAFQIVAMPVFNNTHRRITRRQRKIEGRIALGKDVISEVKRQRSPLQYALWLLWY